MYLYISNKDIHSFLSLTISINLLKSSFLPSFLEVSSIIVLNIVELLESI